MAFVRNRSVSAPTATAEPVAASLPRLTFEAARRAEAMGIVEPAAPRADAAAIRQFANRVRKAGIAASAADLINNVDTPSEAELAGLLEAIVAALEASPVPKYEWRGVSRVFAPEDLADLLTVSLSSLKRYQSGERATPDDVAARLHFLALVVGDLAGSYNEIGIRRWFHRKRTLLDGRTPASFLKRDWDPDDDGPARVRQLARALVTLSAT
jgi:hypothetical protein